MKWKPLFHDVYYRFFHHSSTFCTWKVCFKPDKTILPRGILSISSPKYYICLSEKCILNQTNSEFPWIGDFPPMNEMKTFLYEFSVPYISWFFRPYIWVSLSWFSGLTFGHNLLKLIKQMNTTLKPWRDSSRTHVYISLQKNGFEIHNSKVPVWQFHHNTNVNYSSSRKMLRHFSTKNKENL